MIVYTNRELGIGAITHMKMPKTCYTCHFMQDKGDSFTCIPIQETIFTPAINMTGRASVCPLEPIEFIHYASCPYCGGKLSPMREYKDHYYKHCYSCHFEFQVDVRMDEEEE